MNAIEFLAKLLEQNELEQFDPWKPLRHQNHDHYVSNKGGVVLQVEEGSNLLWPTITLNLPGMERTKAPVQILAGDIKLIKQIAESAMTDYPLLHQYDVALKDTIMQIIDGKLRLVGSSHKEGFSIEPAWNPTLAAKHVPTIVVRHKGKSFGNQGTDESSVIRCFSAASPNILWSVQRALKGPIPVEGKGGSVFASVEDLFDHMTGRTRDMAIYAGMSSEVLEGRLTMLAHLFGQWAKEREENFFYEETLAERLNQFRPKKEPTPTKITTTTETTVITTEELDFV